MGEHVQGYFSYSRGVRQGDPLSPLLFCLAEDFFSRLISSKVGQGLIALMQYTKHELFPTNFLYADDVLLFLIASLKNIRAINDIFSIYSQLLGKK